MWPYSIGMNMRKLWINWRIKMDTGEGYLRMLKSQEVKNLGGPNKMDAMDHYFRVGEVVQLKGSNFKVQRVSPKGLRLKVLKWNRNKGDEE